MNLFLRKLKFLKQRLARGFSDMDLWSLDCTLAQHILPRLEAFREYHGTYPGELTPEEWEKNLGEMIWAFNSILHEEETMPTINEEEREKLVAYFKRRDKGLRLFAEYFMDLWD